MDLKRALSSVTDDEWEKIPEVSNLTKHREVKETRSYAIPDSILVGDRHRMGLETSLSDEQQVRGSHSLSQPILILKLSS
jgi:pre-mRNA-processing factor 6